MSRAIQMKDNDENVYPCPYFPVGFIYLSTLNVNPESFFGGKWQQIQDRFLLTAGSSYKAGSMGGEAAVKLSTSNLPAHNHTGNTNNDGAHFHNSTAIGWAINEKYSYKLAQPPTGSTGFATDIQINNGASNHVHSFSTNNTGGNQAHNNMPPYLVVYAWERIS